MIRKSIRSLYALLRFIFRSFFKKELPKLPGPSEDFEEKIQNNPYLQSKLLWNDVYGDAEKRGKISRQLNFILVGLIAVLLMGFIKIASQTKTQPIPFIIHGDEIITAANIPSKEMEGIKTQLTPYFAKQFIRGWRSVSTDTAVNLQNQITTYAFVSNAATGVVHDFYEAQGNSHPTKEIIITSVLSLSLHTLDVRWKEKWKDIQTGKTIQTEHYIAELTYAYGEPSQNSSVLRINPLGFYITHLSWSLDQATGDHHEKTK